MMINLCRYSTVLLAAAVMGFVAMPPALADDDGAAAFDANCATCHSSGAILRWAERYPETEARIEHYDSFLEGHHAPNDDTRAAIIAYMEETLAAESTED